MCGTSLRSHSQHSLALGGTHSGRVASSSGCGVAVMQRRNRSRTHWSLFTQRVCSPSKQTLTKSAFFFLYRQALWPGFVSRLFCGIVMAKCIFLMSCIAEETVPVGQRRCLFFLMSMSFGTTSYNDFLLPLFKPCLKLEGVQCSSLGRGNLLDYI